MVIQIQVVCDICNYILEELKQYGFDIWFLNIIITLSSIYNLSITMLTIDISVRQAIFSYNKKKKGIWNWSDSKLFLAFFQGLLRQMKGIFTRYSSIFLLRIHIIATASEWQTFVDYGSNLLGVSIYFELKLISTLWKVYRKLPCLSRQIKP